MYTSLPTVNVKISSNPDLQSKKHYFFLHELNQNYKLSVIYFTYLCTYSDKYSGGYFDIIVFIVYTF